MSDGELIAQMMMMMMRYALAQLRAACRFRCVSDGEALLAVGMADMLACRVGQTHAYTVFVRYFWQGNHQIYVHIRCIYTVLANPMCLLECEAKSGASIRL